MYFLLEVFTFALELAGRSLKSISKQLFPLPTGANGVDAILVPVAVFPISDLARKVSVDEQKVRMEDLWGRE